MSSQFLVRIATPDDSDAIGAVLTASYPALMSGSYTDAVMAATLPLMTKANPVLLDSGRFYIAFEPGGQAVGCGGWSHERPGSEERETGLAHIRQFATHKDWVGQGVGRTLFEACAEAARQEDVGRFEVYASLNGEGFYAALGFETIAPFDAQIGETPLPSIRMVCDLR